MALAPLPDKYIPFQSTPSAWRETRNYRNPGKARNISIHSLRMEGDATRISSPANLWHFNPLPPHGGRLDDYYFLLPKRVISIHSLRMEGDLRKKRSDKMKKIISIHSLRMEGDISRLLPPEVAQSISIHSLRMEGDRRKQERTSGRCKFQSTPSAWRETAKLHRKAFFISPILVQSCKKGCKRLHSAPEKMVFFEKREKNLVRNLQHLSVRL